MPLARQTNTAAAQGSSIRSSEYGLSGASPDGPINFEADVGGSSGGSVTAGVRGYAFASTETCIFMQTDPGDLDGILLPEGDYSVTLNVTGITNGPVVRAIYISALDDMGDVVDLMGSRYPDDEITSTGVWSWDVPCFSVLMFTGYSLFVEVAMSSSQSVANATVTFTKDQDFVIPDPPASGSSKIARVAQCPSVFSWRRRGGNGGF